MRMKPIWLSLCAAMVWAAFVAVAPVKAADDYAMKDGKKGEINLREETWVGESLLPAGQYRVQHHVEGADHFVHFEALSRNNPYYRTTGTVAGRPGEVKCRLEPLLQKVERTAIFMTEESGVPQITKIEIAGENVAHLF